MNEDRIGRLRAALGDLRADVEVKLTDAEEALAQVERAQRSEAVRMCREDVQAHRDQLAVLALAERAIEAEADGTPRGGAAAGQGGRGHDPGEDAPAEDGRPMVRAGAA